MFKYKITQANLNEAEMNELGKQGYQLIAISNTDNTDIMYWSKLEIGDELSKLGKDADELIESITVIAKDLISEIGKEREKVTIEDEKV